MPTDPCFEVYPLRERHPDGVEGHFGRPTGEFGWRFRAANGRISAVGGEGFTRREDAHRAVEDLCDALACFIVSDDFANEHEVAARVINVDD